MSAKKKRESKIKELQKRSHSVDNVSDHGSEVDSGEYMLSDLSRRWLMWVVCFFMK